MLVRGARSREVCKLKAGVSLPLNRPLGGNCTLRQGCPHTCPQPSHERARACRWGRGLSSRAAHIQKALVTALRAGCLPASLQVSVTDYVVFDQCSLFQTVIRATHSVATAAQAPVEKVADRLRTAFWSQQLQCQPSLLGVNNSGVWISSGKNEFHVARGSLIGG